MYKILILDESEVFCRTLAELLPDDFEAYTSQSGAQFAELLQTMRPDLLVLDLMISGTDGLYVLETARFAGIRPSVLAVSNFISPYIEGLLEQMKVSYFLQKPCNMQQMVARIIDMAIDTRFQITQQKMASNKEKVENFLRYLGFLPHLNGYRMLVNAICIMIERPRLSMTKELYPEVAEVCGTEWKQAEHAIRNCIHNAYKRRNDWVWKMYFPSGSDGKVGHLKNTAFISCAASLLRETELDFAAAL